VSRSRRTPPAEGDLPPLVLGCRPLPRLIHLAGACYFLVTGTLFLARGTGHPGAGAGSIVAGCMGLLLGGWTAWYTARYGFARLILDDGGFALSGPLGETRVAWSEVVDWRRRPPVGGPFANVLIVYGPERRRLFLPLIYEESQALEVGLRQRGFPKY